MVFKQVTPTSNIFTLNCFLKGFAESKLADIAGETSLDSALPGVQHLCVVVLFGLDASLVLELRQLCRPLFVHNFLQLSSHSAVSLANLAQHVGLMHLLRKTCLNHLLFVGPILALNFGLHILTFVLFHPILLLPLLFLKLYVLLPILVDVLEQVDASLILAIPLSLPLLPLFGVFFWNKFVNHSFISFLVGLLLRGKLLKLDRLVAMGHSLLVLNLLDGAFPLNSSL